MKTIAKLAIVAVLGISATAIAATAPPPPQQKPPPTTQQQPPPPQQQPPPPPPTQPPPPTTPPPPPPPIGNPLPRLTPEQLGAFVDGLEDFEQVETIASGLGPIFNNVSCVACHSSPAPGGASDITVTRFGRVVNGRFDPLESKGGSLLQQFAIDPAAQEIVPPEANVVAHRITTPLFGAGLVEALPDRDIVANVRTNDLDGVRGKPSFVQDIASGRQRVGRFGWKAQQASLLAFAGDAYVNEMGITSRLFPVENAPNGNTNLVAQFDTVPDAEDEVDPQTGKAGIDRFADFMRFLAPPPRRPLSPKAELGRQVFDQLACAKCHTPMMRTGPSPVAALDRKEVWAFSDWLLHDMGALGDGIGQGAAGPREMRSAPLWGLAARKLYLHDGRAATVDQAIRAHDGEGARSRIRYLQLPPDKRLQLLEFLNSI